MNRHLQGEKHQKKKRLFDHKKAGFNTRLQRDTTFIYVFKTTSFKYNLYYNLIGLSTLFYNIYLNRPIMKTTNPTLIKKYPKPCPGIARTKPIMISINPMASHFEPALVISILISPFLFLFIKISYCWISMDKVFNKCSEQTSPVYIC